MSTALKNWLATHQVSLENYEMTDGEQKLDVHVSPEPSVDQELAELEESKIKQDEIQKDCEAMVEAQTAMEDYADLLTHGMENGGINGQAAAFMRLGMERFEAMFGIDEPLTPSVEAFGGSASQQHSTQVSLESVSETLKKSWEAIKRALTALVNAIKDVYAKATNAADRLEKRATALRAKAQSAKGQQAKSDKITISGASRLYADGVWKGDDVATITGFLTYGLGRYPEAAIKYAQRVMETVRQIKPDSITKESAATILKMTDTILQDFQGKAASSSDKRFAGDTEVKHTEVLPGNMALYVAQPVVKGDELAALRKLASTLRADMLAVPEAKAGEKTHEITVATPDVLANRAGQIANAAGIITKSKQNSDKIRKVVDDLMKAGDDLRDRADKAELNEEQKKVVDATLRGLVAIQRLLGGTVNGIIAYGVRTLNAQLVVVERQLAAYKVEAKSDDE